MTDLANAIFAPTIQQWFTIEKRDLPWRNTTDPYCIWLSEIILQQTRVNQGLRYYIAFVEAFPTVFDLANAPEDAVLKLWQGLGYYSRARNLHATAKILAHNKSGLFPTSFKEILNLKGVGPYTAAAIASFAFNLPHAVVDGNVYRVLARYCGLDVAIDSSEGKKLFQQLADDFLDHNNPALYNQAIMEFGALLCTPKKPNCTACPLRNSCMAYANGTVEQLPVKAKKTKVRHRFFTYFIPIQNGTTFLRKRPSGDIWEGLWEFPLVETSSKADNFITLTPEGFKANSWLDTGYEKVHKLSHQHLHCRFLIAENPTTLTKKNEYIAMSLSDLKDFPVPVLLSQFIEHYIIPLHLEEKHKSVNFD